MANIINKSISNTGRRNLNITPSEFSIGTIDLSAVDIVTGIESYDIVTGIESSFLEVVESASATDMEPMFLEVLESDSALIDENFINRKRLNNLRRRFTRELLQVINQEDFEYGKENKADLLVKQQMDVNASVTKEWLNYIFVENFDNVSVLVGILRIIGHIDYDDIRPNGVTMALSALTHNDIEVKECGIRAFENWEALENIKVLENLDVMPKWLQDYINQVIIDLKKEHNVAVG